MFHSRLREYHLFTARLPEVVLISLGKTRVVFAISVIGHEFGFRNNAVDTLMLSGKFNICFQALSFRRHSVRGISYTLGDPAARAAGS